MTSRTWPTAAYIRWIIILYLIAAAAAASITFFVIALLYATKGTLFFLAGAITGAVISAIIRYLVDRGVFTYLARMMDAILHRTPILRS
jgi:uncharacterized membrane protein